jgi:hypothetical protein
MMIACHLQIAYGVPEHWWRLGDRFGELHPTGLSNSKCSLYDPSTSRLAQTPPFFRYIIIGTS